jgi:ribosomal 50S subunit-associated protein YjgA (DUF615 family)
MNDDRTSFIIKSRSQIGTTTELDALGATAARVIKIRREPVSTIPVDDSLRPQPALPAAVGGEGRDPVVRQTHNYITNIISDMKDSPIKVWLILKYLRQPCSQNSLTTRTSTQ